MTQQQRLRIGDLLVEKGRITDEQLKEALTQQKQTGRKLGRQLIEMGFVSEEDMLDLLSEQLKIPRVDLRHYRLDPETVQKLPETHARRFRAIVLEDTGEDYLVGLADPTDIFAYDELARVLKKPVRLAVVSEDDLLNGIDTSYRRTDEIANLAEELGEEVGSEDDIDLSTLAEDQGEANAPVVRLLQSIMEDAVQVGASDVHIEPDERGLRIRQRVDGVLQEHIMQQKNVAPALISRLKIMCGLNISERRMPQDGRFQVRVRGRSIDVRLSTLPMQHGESVVMRLLDQSQGILSLDSLGMPAEVLRRFRRRIHQPHGLVLVTGPTGSGKTTTLYGALSEINKAEVKIITAEDPVEYRLARVNQVQVREDIGFSFARVLRSALRQDPDILMVGEMRDEETAMIGLRAAVTGHLVFSTLHTNDAVATAIRLLDMGAESYMLSAALRGILAQRLLRRLCDNCKAPYQPEDQERIWLRGTLGEQADTITFYHGRGCHRCNNTGYRGRMGVFELLEINAEMADALRRGDQAEFAAACRRDPHYRPMSMVALDYAREGVTSLEEVFRVLGEVEEEEETEGIREAGSAPPVATGSEGYTLGQPGSDDDRPGGGPPLALEDD
ncbi:MAG: GspE/PulE family protein [Thiohalospira sp.]